jgi:hypothetical protein
MILTGVFKYSEKNPSQCHSVHHKSQMYRLGSGPGAPNMRLAPNHLHHGTAPKPVCFQLGTKMTGI